MCKLLKNTPRCAPDGPGSEIGKRTVVSDETIKVVFRRLEDFDYENTLEKL